MLHEDDQVVPRCVSDEWKSLHREVKVFSAAMGRKERCGTLDREKRKGMQRRGGKKEGLLCKKWRMESRL